MKSILSKGIICHRDKHNIEYCLCVIEYQLYEDEKFKYSFIPNYEVIDLLSDDEDFQGIPGIDLSLKKDIYVRENINPTFIAERTPASNREDLYKLLEKVGMDYLNPIEYLIRTKDKYSGDFLYLVNFKEKERIYLEDVVTKSNISGIIKIALNNIASGNEVYLKNGVSLNNKDIYKTLLFLYEKNIDVQKYSQSLGIKESKEQKNYKGRKPIEVDALQFKEQMNLVERKKITARKAASNLGISIDKYYRMKKVLQK